VGGRRRRRAGRLRLGGDRRRGFEIADHARDVDLVGDRLGGVLGVDKLRLRGVVAGGGVGGGLAGCGGSEVGPVPAECGDPLFPRVIEVGGD
jgi:hypothetical protein